MKPKQFFFTLLGILIVVIGGGGYGYSWAIQQINGQSAQLSMDQAEEQAATTEITSLEELESNYKHNIIPVLPMIDEAIPTNKNQTEILAQIERIAAADGVDQPFKAVTMPSPVGLPSLTSQTVKVGALLVLPISFQATGTYQQLQEFTYDLETLNRYTNVSSLSINATNKPSVAYTFTIDAFVYPQ